MGERGGLLEELKVGLCCEVLRDVLVLVLMFRFVSFLWGGKRKIKVKVVKREVRLEGDGRLDIRYAWLYEGTAEASWGPLWGISLLICLFALSFSICKRTMKSIRSCAAIQCIDVLFYADPCLYSLKISW